MNIFKLFRSKKKKQGPTRRQLYDICDETNSIVDGIQQMLRDLAEQKSSGKKPQEPAPQASEQTSEFEPDEPFDTTGEEAVNE